MRVRRGVLRVMATAVMAACMVGVPLAVARFVGLPWPSGMQLREAWSDNTIDADLVLSMGGAIFTVLWLWFVVTALAELLHVIRWRIAGPATILRPLPTGPDRWIRQLMRFIALSSVSATATLGGLLPGAKHATAVNATRSVGGTHQVVAGDCYWDIADQHLEVALQREPTPREVLRYTEELVAVNAPLLGHRDPTMIWPGESVLLDRFEPVHTTVADPIGVTVPPPVATPDAIPEDGSSSITPVVIPPDSPSDRSSVVGPYVAGLGTALLLSAGAVGLLEKRRRRQWRAAIVGSRLAAPSTTETRTESTLRSLAGPERLARLDVALRAAAPDLAAQGAVVQAAILEDSGGICLFIRGSATPSDVVWQLELHANTWRLSEDVSLESLATRARTCAQPCQALVHIGGVAQGGELFVDLEAVGVLSVQSPHAVEILRHAAASLAVSPFLETVRMFTVGVGETSLDVHGVEEVDSLDAALDAAAMTLGSTMSASRSTSTFALRVAGAGGEAWEPSIVIAAGAHDSGELAHLASLCTPGRGLAAMVEGAIDSSGWQLRAEAGTHVIEPLGLHIAPVACSAADVAAVTGLLHTSSVEPEVVDVGTPRGSAGQFVEPDWAIIVRVLGQVNVESRAGVVAEFERSKALELVVWLSQHRRRPTRNAARTALWDLDVRDATFANVVSDARRALARAISPPEGDEWIARTLTEDLPMHPRVVTDAELLAARVEHARGLPALDAIGVLRPGLELVAGMPFAGTGYLWPDAEGTTSSLVLLATGAAIELANHYLSLGDVDGVFWATGQGLKVLAGHEELIALRMRSQARNGDLAGVRAEWEAYERALNADPWAAAEPSPKLAALRRELLSPQLTAS